VTSVRAGEPGASSVAEPDIGGHWRPEFDGVVEEFRRNFTDRGEVGASLCVRLDGQSAIDVWGGVADPVTGRRWEQDTVCVVFSSTKGALAMIAHLMAQAGELDLDAPVVQFWPEYGQSGKAETSVSMLLDHSAGVPVLREPVKDDALEDWDYMVARIEAETPWWEPGTRHGYHPLTFGFTVGEVLRRVAGMPLGDIVRTRLAEPLGIDFWLGLPENIEPRVAPIQKATTRPGRSAFDTAMRRERGSIPNLFGFNSGMWPRGGFNTRAGHVAQIGAAGGITNARGLAGLYAPASRPGSAGPVTVGPATAARMGTVFRQGEDATLLVPTAFSQGFMLPVDNRHQHGPGFSVLMGPHAFGHIGSGGSFGFADPDHGLSVGYVMNQQGAGLLGNDRGEALVECLYAALGAPLGSGDTGALPTS
jgi:CubicO group peptidase (beta-lactamase class C family)